MNSFILLATDTLTWISTWFNYQYQVFRVSIRVLRAWGWEYLRTWTLKLNLIIDIWLNWIWIDCNHVIGTCLTHWMKLLTRHTHSQCHPLSLCFSLQVYLTSSGFSQSHTDTDIGADWVGPQATHIVRASQGFWFSVTFKIILNVTKMAQSRIVSHLQFLTTP